MEQQLDLNVSRELRILTRMMVEFGRRRPWW